MGEVGGRPVQLALGRRATTAKASLGKSGFPVLAAIVSLSIFVLLFILHPTVLSAPLPLAVPQPAVPSSLARSLLTTAGITDCARVPEPQLPHFCYSFFPFIIPQHSSLDSLLSLSPSSHLQTQINLQNCIY